MLSSKLQDAINQQINAEMYSAYLYLSMAAHFESVNLGGFAHWMKLQHGEETVHAMKLFDFVNDSGGRVVLQAISAPPVEFGSALEVMEQTLAHERMVTGMINRLYGLAEAEKDHAARAMLDWFIEEQVEEEKTAEDIVERLKIGGSEGAGLLMEDATMGKRGAG